MRFHVFYFTPHPSASYAITQKCEMGNARRHWYISNLPRGECARDWVLDSLRRSWLGQSWTLLWFMTFPIRADNEAREGLGTRLGLQHYVHKSQISSVCRSSLILYSFSCNRTDHQSDSFLPNVDWKVFTQNEISSKTTNLRECTATCPHHRGDVLVSNW